MIGLIHRILFHARMVALFLTDRDAYDEARMMDDHANWHYGRVAGQRSISPANGTNSRELH